MRSLRIIHVILKNSWKQVVLFKANFILVIISNLLWFLFTIVFFQVIFHSVQTVANWSLDDVIVLLCTNQIIISLYGIFFRQNLERIPGKVRDGSLDLDLTKPINPIFWLSCQRIQSVGFVSILLPVIILVLTVGKLNVPAFSFTSWLLYFMIVCGAVIIRLIFGLLVSCIAIKFIQVRSYFALQSEIFQYGSYPDSIYTIASRFFFSFIIPIILLANLPAKLLLGKPVDSRFLIYFYCYILFGLVLAILIFRQSLRAYSSGGG